MLRRLASASARRRELPPGPRRPRLLQSAAWVQRPAEFLLGSRRRFGTRFTLRFTGGRDYVIVSDPEAVKAVFTGPPELFVGGRGNQNMAPFLGEHSLLTLQPGEVHRRHRRLFGAPFRGKRMEAYGELIYRLTLEELRGWPVGRPFEIIEPMRRVTLQAIFRAVFGVEDSQRARRLAELTSELTSAVAWFAFLRVPRIDAGRASPWGRFLRARAEFDRLLAEEIARARRESPERADILARLIAETEATGEEMGEREICDALITLLAAGHETSAATAAWAFHWVLASPEVRTRLAAEAREVLGPAGFDPERLGDLSYARAAVMETLRLVPVIPIVPRFVGQDADVAGTPVPGGSYVAPCPLIAQRDPARYPDPDRFDPDRFADGRPGPFDYFPFGGGSRLCIGAPFGLYEVTAVLAAVLGTVDVRLADPRPQRIGRHGLTLVPARGTPVVLNRPPARLGTRRAA